MKILAREELIRKINWIRKESWRKIIFTNGCFDILHVGHIRCLEEAKALGGVLIVGINNDDSVKALKGDKRPLIPEDERAEIVASLESVDYVTVFHEHTPLELIERIKPDIIVKGGDYKEDEVVGRKFAKVVIIPEVKGVSTTQIIERIRRKI